MLLLLWRLQRPVLEVPVWAALGRKYGGKVAGAMGAPVGVPGDCSAGQGCLQALGGQACRLGWLVKELEKYCWEQYWRTGSLCCQDYRDSH